MCSLKEGKLKFRNNCKHFFFLLLSPEAIFFALILLLFGFRHLPLHLTTILDRVLRPLVAKWGLGAAVLGVCMVEYTLFYAKKVK